MSTNEERPADGPDATVGRLRDDIDQTRKDMTQTLGELEERLSPGVLGGKANAELDHLEARVKSAVKEGIEEAKAAVSISLKEGVQEAKAAVAVTLKEGVRDAKEAVTHGLKEARETVKKDVQDAITHTKHSVREATLGRVETLATQAGDVMNDTRDTLVETIRRNPIPAAIAGVGLAWLFMNRSSANRRRSSSPTGYGYSQGGAYAGASYGAESGRPGSGASFVADVGHAMSGAQHAATDAVGNVAHHVGDVAGQVGSAVGSAVGHAGSSVAGAAQSVAGVAHDAGAAALGALGHGASAANQLVHDQGARLGHLAVDTAGQIAHQAHDAAATARDQAARVEGAVAGAWEKNPLAFGAAALVAGATLGYALPGTQKEDELMGAVRDRAVHNVAELAGQAVHSLEHLAEAAGGAAKTVVASAAG